VNIREIFLLAFITTKLETHNKFRLECKMESIEITHENSFGDLIPESSLWFWGTSHLSVLHIIHSVVLQRQSCSQGFSSQESLGIWLKVVQLRSISGLSNPLRFLTERS